MKSKKKARFFAGNRSFATEREAYEVLRPMMGPGECIPVYKVTPSGVKKVVSNLCVNDAGFAYIRKDI